MNADCQRALLNLDRDLDGAELKWVDAHLAACGECGSEAAARARIRAGLRRAVKAMPPDRALEVRVREAIATPTRWRGWHGYAAAAVFAAGIYLAAPAIQSKLGEEAYFYLLPRTVSDLMRVGLNDHVHCAVFRKYLKPPVATDLPEPFRPVLNHIPARYQVRAAHECKAHGRSYIHLVLHDSAGKIASLVMARKRPGETFATAFGRRMAGATPIFTEEVPRYQIDGFETSAFLVFVVSDMHGEENQRLAAALSAPVSQILNTIG